MMNDVMVFQKILDKNSARLDITLVRKHQVLNIH